MQISWSRDAFDDLEAIYRHLSQYDPRIALKTLGLIHAKASLLEQFPRLGAPLDRGTRRLAIPTTPYLIVYVFEANDIYVVRVFDSRQDWQGQIDEA